MAKIGSFADQQLLRIIPLNLPVRLRPMLDRSSRSDYGWLALGQLLAPKSLITAFRSRCTVPEAFEPTTAFPGPACERPLQRIPDVPINPLELNSGDDAAGKLGAFGLMMVRPIRSPQEFGPLSRHSGNETRHRTFTSGKQNNRKNLHDRHRLWRTRRAPGTSAGQL